MSMFWISRSKFKHQILRSKKNYGHTTHTSKVMDEIKKSGTKKKSSLDTTVHSLYIKLWGNEEGVKILLKSSYGPPPS